MSVFNKIYVKTSLRSAQLSLDVNTISSINTNGNISIIPNGTGEVLLKANPSSNLGASTKQYTDTKATINDSLNSSTAETWSIDKIKTEVSSTSSGGDYRELSGTSSSTVNSTSFVDIGGMTTTPPSGTYKVDFSCWFENDQNNYDDGLEVALFKAGTVIEHSTRRNWTGEAGKYETSIHTQAIITVNGSQNIKVRAKKLYYYRIRILQRSMIIVRVGSAI
jgi:hypothetical protein